MSHTKRWSLRVLSVVCVAWAATCAVADGMSLLGGEWSGPGKAGGGGFSFAGKADRRAIMFDSGAGFATIERPVSLGTKPFAFSWEVTITKGRRASWRNSGLAVALASCSLGEMTDEDIALVMCVQQQGVRCTVVRGGCYTRHEARPGVWRFRDRELPRRYVLSMSGGGGHNYSIRWPGKDVAGTTLRFTVWRDGENTIRYAVFHSASPHAPWWTGRYTLPEPYAAKGLTTLALRTTNEAACADRPPPQVTFRGRITLLAARGLDAGQAFTPAPLEIATPSHWVLKGPPAAKHPSVFYTPKTLGALRKKFHDPAMVHYRTLILRAAAPDAVDKKFQGSPSAWSSAITALTWAYVLTEDKAYLDRLLHGIDRLTTTNNHLKHTVRGWPGHAKQFLSVDEFNGHNVEALATAYDCLHNRLDDVRRRRILRLLNRALDYYLGRVKANDWWYCNNPSNTIGVGNGLNGVLALVLRAYRPADAKAAVEAALRMIQTKYVGVAEDGGCVEGNMYWNYGMSYPIWFGYALKQVTGDDRGLLTAPRMLNAENYLKLMIAGDGTFLCFNDTQPWLNGMLICAHAGRVHDRPLLRKMADHQAARFASIDAFGEQVRGQFAVSAFLGRDTVAAPKEWPALPTLHIVRSIQEGILRSDGRFTPTLVTGVKGKGKRSTHHANEDQGSVVIYANGENFLLDPGYFEPAAGDHTLPVVGPYVRRKTWDPRAVAPLIDAWEDGDRRGMTVDATAAHVAIRAGKDTPARGSVRRVIAQVADKAVIWLDDVRVPEAAGKVTAHYQCGFPVTLDKDGRRCRILGARSDLAVLIDGPATSLTSTGRRKFSRDWVYSKLDVQWYPVRAVYAADALRPMITVCMPVAKDAEFPNFNVKRSGASIQVTVVGAKPVVFDRVKGLWRSKRR